MVETVTPIIDSSPSSFRVVAKSAKVKGLVLDREGRPRWELCGGLTHVILTNVYSFSADGEGYIHSVIDQQRDGMLLCDLVQFFGSLDQCKGVASLVTVLNNRDSCSTFSAAALLRDRSLTSFDGSLDYLDKVTAFENCFGRVCHQV